MRKKDIPKCFKAKVDDVHACLIQIVFNTKIDSTPLSWDKLKIQSYLICFNAFVERYQTPLLQKDKQRTMF